MNPSDKLLGFVQDANREILAGRRVKQLAVILAEVTDGGAIPPADLLREIQEAMLEYGRVCRANLEIRDARRTS
jgi:hypothetical protein